MNIENVIFTKKNNNELSNYRNWLSQSIIPLIMNSKMIGIEGRS